MKSFLPSTSISRFLFAPKPHLSPTPFFHIFHFSTTPTSSPSYRRNDEETRNVRVSVWWDFDNCSLPNNVNVFKVAHFITAAVRSNGIKGPVSINAFGDVLQLSRDNQSALFDAGITLTHVPTGGKSGADKSLVVDLLHWVSQNPPPAHLFLISGDPDFASVLHRLRMHNYNILLASADCSPGILCSSASIMWQWSALVRGENLMGKYFNQPPDASWYGHYNTCLADPFAVAGQPSNVADEVSECGPDLLRAIPDTLVKRIRNILNTYPKGISTADLRDELRKTNTSIDKYYYGHRKFSRFLLAMPQILKLKPDMNMSGQYIVHGIPTNIYGENESTSRSSIDLLATKDEGWNSSNPVKSNGQRSSSKELADVKPLQHFVSEPKLSGSPTKPPEPMKVHELPKPYTEGVNEKLLPRLSHVRVVETRKMQDHRKPQEPSEDRQETARVVQDASQLQMVGTPKIKDCRKSEEASEHAQEKAGVVQEADKREVKNSELLVTDDHSSVFKLEVKEKILKFWFGSENGVYNEKYSTVVKTPSGPGMNTKEKKEANSADNSAATVDDTAQPSSLFNKVRSWFRSWRSLEESDDGASEKSQKLDSSSHRLFSKDSFWNDMKAFLNTPRGSMLVMKAKSRSEMGRALEREGPRALASLSGDELLQLVGILISDKKRVEESASLFYPFKLAEIAPKGAPDGEKKWQKRPHAGFAQPAVQKLGNKSRSEIIGDIKILVQFIVKTHPKGYNISLFEKLFLDKFGYPLEFQNLGYPELGRLLKIMPGIRIESGLIMPSGEGLHASGRKDLDKPSGKLSKEPQKDEGNESPWAELGSLFSAVSDEESTKSKAKEIMKGQLLHHCELLPEDDDETTLSTKKRGTEQREGSDGDSTLSKILDSYYGSKEGSIRTSNSKTVDSSDEYVEDGTSAACRSRKSGETKEGSIRTSNSKIVDSSDEYVEDVTSAACTTKSDETKEGSIRTNISKIVDSSDEYVEDGTSAACRSRKSGETKEGSIRTSNSKTVDSSDEYVKDGTSIRSRKLGETKEGSIRTSNSKIVDSLDEYVEDGTSCRSRKLGETKEGSIITSNSKIVDSSDEYVEDGTSCRSRKSGESKEASIRTSNSNIVDSSDEYVEDGTSTAFRSRKSGETQEGSIRTSNSKIVDGSDEYVEDSTSAACRSRKSGEFDMPVYGRRKRSAESYYTSVRDQQSCEHKLIDTLRSMIKPVGK